MYKKILDTAIAVEISSSYGRCPVINETCKDVLYVPAKGREQKAVFSLAII
jgi:hypothetical protein